MNLRDFSLLLLVCFGWAAHTIISKIVVSGMEIPPLFYAAIRYALVAVFAVPWLLPMPKPRWRILLVGFLMGGGGFALFFIGIKTASPSSSAVVQQLGLPMTALLSMVLLGERIQLKRGLGMVLTFLGAVLVMWDPNGLAVSGGLVFIAIGVFAGSVASVMMKQIDGVRPLQFQAWVGLTSVIPLSLLSVTFESGQLTRASEAGWLFAAAVLFSALFVSMLTHTIYYGLILRHPASLIAPLMLMSPLMTVALGILITGDKFDARTTFGSALALTGVLVISLGRKHVVAAFNLVRARRLR
jgi:drug/metabolite transporter (DMT)-like permease